MTASSPEQPEQASRLAYQIRELVPDISETDEDLLTRIASFDQRVSTVSTDFEYLMPWALDLASSRPHTTAKTLREDNTLGMYQQEALELGLATHRSDIAYRVTANQRITWMARLNPLAHQILNYDSVYRERKNDHAFEPNAPWLYRRMQSRLLVCTAWMAEGKPMERQKINPSVRERIAVEISRALISKEYGI